MVSGGIDSVTMAHELKAAGHQLRVVSFDYGQRHVRELDCASQAADDLGAVWHRIDLAASGLRDLLSGSALTDPTIAVPEGHYAADNMRLTIVPNRNAIMLSIAYAEAVSSGSSAVAIAVHAGDHTVYPDCRPGFISAFEAMEKLATDEDIELLAPYMGVKKSDIVARGVALGVAYERTWSCYVGGEVHCGACGTCHERREAFEVAGVKDPTIYAATPVLPRP